MNSSLKNLFFWMVVVVIGVVIWNFSTQFRPSDNTITFSEFMSRVDMGQVAKVTIADGEVRAETKGHDTFRTYSPGYNDLVPRLLEKGVQIDVKPGASSPWAPLFYSWAPLLGLASVFPIALIAIAAVMLRRMRRIDDKLDRLLSRDGHGPAAS